MKAKHHSGLAGAGGALYWHGSTRAGGACWAGLQSTRPSGDQWGDRQGFVPKLDGGIRRVRMDISISAPKILRYLVPLYEFLL